MLFKKNIHGLMLSFTSVQLKSQERYLGVISLTGILLLSVMQPSAFTAQESNWSRLKYIGSIHNVKNLNRFIKKLPETPTAGQATGKHHACEDAILNHNNSDFSLLGIADGHGGGRMAKIIASGTNGILADIKNLQGSYTPLKITNAFLSLNRRNKEEKSGSTLSIVINKENDPNLFMANIADSPIFIVTRDGKIYRSIDHDYKNQDEINRMQNQGVRFENGRYIAIQNNYIVGLQPSKDFGAIGQQEAFKPTPDVYAVDKSKIAFVLITSDGINDAWFKKNGKPDDETRLVDDFINEALKVSPDDNQGFGSGDFKKVAQHYGIYHPDDMSIIIHRFSPDGHQVIKPYSFDTMKPYIVVAGAALGTAAIIIAAHKLFGEKQNKEKLKNIHEI